MNKKYFFADLDGTLIYRQESYLNPASNEKEAIRDFVAEGHDFIIATGRMYPDVVRVLENINITSPYVISQNGSYIYKNGEEIRGTNLTTDQVRRLRHAILNEWHFKPEYISITTSNFINYMQTFTWKGWGVKRYFKRRKEDSTSIKTWRKKTLSRLEKEHTHIARLLIGYHNSKKISELEEMLRSKFGDEMEIYISGKYSVEICAAGVSKAAAIQFIMERESLSAEQVAFVGDSGNDVSVFEALPNTYVMKHANERFKVGNSQETNRVADAIEDFRMKELKINENQ